MTQAGLSEGHAPATSRRLGGPVIDGLRDLRDLFRLLGRTLSLISHGKREKGAIVEQMYFIGNRSLVFMCITMGFIGAIITFQSAVQSQRLLPDLTMLGATFIKLLVRDMAASLGAMPLATRVGAGIAAEIGSMVVTDQVDALRMCAADPVDYLVVPRFIAATLMGTAVLIIAGAVSIVSGMLIANGMFDVNFHTYLNFSMVTLGDVALGVTKMIAFCAAIAIISAQRGLATFGGSEGVGTATTRAVVGSSFAIIVLNFFISGLGYFFVPS
ncbi:MAG: ABC transporter permease [Deltaproteobacteria bacterium]|nr:ABC transporter permease [Deltaproteobacteria bacterium]